jgi:branched-chain amino acid transport system permease protein
VERTISRRPSTLVVFLIVIGLLFVALFAIGQGGLIPIAGPCFADFGVCANNPLKIGLFNGLIVALIAMGYTLVYGILQLINFANGDVFMIGSMLTFFGVTFFGLSEGSGAAVLVPVLLGLLFVIMLLTATLNASIERLAYRPLRNAPTLATLISAIGMSFVLQNVGQIILGPSPKSLPKILPTNVVFSIGPVDFTFNELFVAAVTIPLLIALAWFVKNTRQGKAMRATAQDREAAGLMGINVNRTISLTFLLAGALAGGAGLVVALFYGQAWWFFGFPFGLLAFTAAVLGGIGNLTGAALGGVVLGLIRAMTDYYIDPKWTNFVVFSILILVLVFKPTGLLGAKQAEGS